MIGQPYNPNNCGFLSNQALNTNQGNDNVPNGANNPPHILLWDFVENKIQWVNSLTNIVERELSGGAAVDSFNKKINGPFDTNDVPNTFGQCFIDLEAGDYIFDVDVTAKRTSLLDPIGQTVAEIRINTTQGPNVDPGDQLIETRESFINLGATDESYSMHLMSGKVQVSGPFTFKAAFWDGIDGAMSVENIMMRAIKIG